MLFLLISLLVLSNSMVFDIESLNHSINHGINHVPEFCKKKMVLVPKFLKTVLHLKLNVQLFNKDTYSSFIHWIRILTFAVYSCFFFPFSVQISLFMSNILQVELKQPQRIAYSSVEGHLISITVKKLLVYCVLLSCCYSL